MFRAKGRLALGSWFGLGLGLCYIWVVSDLFSDRFMGRSVG